MSSPGRFWPFSDGRAGSCCRARPRYLSLYCDKNLGFFSGGSSRARDSSLALTRFPGPLYGSLIELQVRLGGALPGKVRSHGALHQSPPCLGVPKPGDGTVHGSQQGIHGELFEDEAQPPLRIGVEILDGVRQAAGSTHHRNGSVTKRDELAEAAGLVAGGHQKNIRSGVDLPSEIGLESLIQTELARKLLAEGGEGVEILRGPRSQ